MKQKMTIINAQHFSNAINDFNCGKKPFIEVDTTDFWLAFYDVKPSEGYQVPENAETGEKLPNCCETHKQIFKNTQDWFDRFPLCCEPHKNLLKTTWFKKENYNGVVMKIVQQLAYTTSHIGKQLEAPDWYKDITDYIEYNVESFGQLPLGYGAPVGVDIYLWQLKNWIEHKDVILPAEKRKKLSKYIEWYYKPPPVGTDSRDLNILYATYHKWLKLFPFEISYFSKLKEHFSNQLPILAEPPVANKYTGLAKAKIQSQTGLIETLHNLTTQLLQQINISDLLKNGLITDTNKHSIELANANHQLKQSSLLTRFTKGEMKYVKVLKAWLANEKGHFKEILPMINNTGNNAGDIQNNDVLNRDEYFQIIMEIYNLHRNTVGEFVAAKIKKHLPANPQFIECLYKDINKIMEGVHRPGDMDLDISSGDMEVKYGDIKLTGNATILDDTLTFLWMELSKLYIEKWGILNLTEHLKAFETNIIQRDDYMPAYAKKVAELNRELKIANGILSNAGDETKNENQNLKLTDIFINDAAYSVIMKLLIDKGYCQTETLKWKDKGKGNKGLLIAILKDLRVKGYYKNGINPSNNDYKKIAKNTFDWNMSIDTIKKTNPEKFRLNFIPANTNP